MRRALPDGGTLLLAEPMAYTSGAAVMSDAYFGFYLLAMGSGRARSAARLTGLLTACGFGSVRHLPTWLPLQTSLLVARAEINERSGRAADAANDYEKAVSMLDPGYERIDDFRARIAVLRASVGNSAAGTAFRDLLRSGKLQSILRVQVFLNNRGFDDVTIDGKPSAALEKALERCLSNSECRESMGRSI